MPHSSSNLTPAQARAATNRGRATLYVLLAITIGALSPFAFTYLAILAGGK